MGEVTSLTFLPFGLLIFLVTFCVHIYLAFGWGNKVTCLTFVFRLCDFMMFFIPVISKHRVCWCSDRTLFTLKPSSWIVRSQMQFEIVVVVCFVFTFVAKLNEILVFCFYVAVEAAFSEPPIITLVARKPSLIVNFNPVSLQLDIVCFEITVGTRHDLVFPLV